MFESVLSSLMIIRYCPIRVDTLFLASYNVPKGNNMFSGSNTKIATSITTLIALFLLWLFFGHTSEHIWSSVLFFLSFVAVIVVATRDWLDYIRKEMFEKKLAISIFVLAAFLLFANIEINQWGTTEQPWFAILNVIRYIVVAAYGAFLLFTIIRVIQENN